MFVAAWPCRFCGAAGAGVGRRFGLVGSGGCSHPHHPLRLGGRLRFSRDRLGPIRPRGPSRQPAAAPRRGLRPDATTPRDLDPTRATPDQAAGARVISYLRHSKTHQVHRPKPSTRNKSQATPTRPSAQPPSPRPFAPARPAPCRAAVRIARSQRLRRRPRPRCPPSRRAASPAESSARDRVARVARQAGGLHYCWLSQAVDAQASDKGAVIDTATSCDEPTVGRAPDELGRELARLMRLTAAAKARNRAEGGPVPDGGDRLLLAYLVLEGPRRVTDLAVMTYLDVSTVSRQVASLVQRELVERRPDPNDGRGTLLAATDAGRQAFEVYRRRREVELDRVTHDWSADERRMLVHLLERFNDGLERDQSPTRDAAPEPGRPPTPAAASTPVEAAPRHHQTHAPDAASGGPEGNPA
jgi:DNA-binding MarR family transcriptional regulator